MRSLTPPQRRQFESVVLAHQEPGSALCFHPLFLHRAEKMTTTGRRRILHPQFGPDLKQPGTETYRWPQPRPLDQLTSEEEENSDD